jgi:hypothetical protein
MSVGKRMVPSSNYASNHVDGNNGLVSFCTAKHDKIGRSTLIDMADWFEVGLLDLGHEVTFSDDHLEARAINVFGSFSRQERSKKLRNRALSTGSLPLRFRMDMPSIGARNRNGKRDSTVSVTSRAVRHSFGRWSKARCRFIHNFARRYTKSRSESIFDTNHRGIQPGFLGA